MSWLFALITLTLMETVLGIDNIIFISILCGRLPESQRKSARNMGLAAAMGTRLILLMCINLVMSLTNPVFNLSDIGVPQAAIEALVPGPPGAGHGAHGTDEGDAPEPVKPSPEAVAEVNGVSVKDLILLVGGLFLIFHSIMEIHHKLEGEEDDEEGTSKAANYWGIITQIALLDLIFSLDSVITAVGMANQIWVMVLAVIISIGIMMAFAGHISDFVDRNPTIKILALSFLILIGVLLVAEGIGTHFNKGYVYFAMAFSLVVELINMRVRVDKMLPKKRKKPQPVAI
ncbi:MAG: TerC family protein [Planctomycetaceae bacterium]|nr:TerC family protein [Planctomycetaceae bacterium]